METAFDIISLVLFIVVILLAFFRKVNVGVVAVTFGVIMVRIFGLTDKDLIGGFSTSMFTTLVGITLLFAAITQTGALDLLARKIIALAGNKMWVLPIMVYIAGFVIAGVGACAGDHPRTRGDHRRGGRLQPADARPDRRAGPDGRTYDAHHA